MNKESAIKIVSIAVSLDAPISNLRLAAEGVGNTVMRLAIKRCADEIMGIVNRDIIGPLVEIYPDIDPDQ